MGAQTRNQRLAGNAAERLGAYQASRQGAGQRQPQTASASMFPGEAPGSSIPTGMEEAMFRRGEVTAERDRTGRREEIFQNFERAAQSPGAASVTPGGAVERGASAFGAPFGGAGQGSGGRSGVMFGPGRSNRMPAPNTPEYQQLVQRARQLGGR